jgi:hypothetical protein
VTGRAAFVVTALLALVIGCTSTSEPALPPPSDVAAAADRVTAPDGQAFLRDITSASWDDDGRRAAEIFAWIPQDAQSSDRLAAARAGETAHAIASFLADERESIADAPANPALWQALTKGLIPYLGAMVGDETGVAGFEPLDGLESQMRRTASVFAAIAGHADPHTLFTDAASERANSYETAFAKSAVSQPPFADRGIAQRDLQQAARIRGLIAAGVHLADPESKRPTPTRAQTHVAYQVASLTARPGDPHIDPAFFAGMRLKSPGEISDKDWSIYDSQLTVFLAPWPQILDAIEQFGRIYSLIATG